MKKAITNLVYLLSLLAAGPVQAGIIIGVTPSTQSVNAGTPVNVAVTISGLGDLTAPSLSTFDLDISFDPTLLTFSNATFGDPVLGDQLDVSGLGLNPTFAGVILPGVLNLFELSFDSPSDLNNLQAGSFTLATVAFNTFAGGTSALDISRIILGDINGDPLIADSVSSGSITIQGGLPIPEPTTMLLLCFGIVGLYGVRQMKKRNNI